MLIRGDQLPENARRQVLAAYVYRWTHDNKERKRAWSCAGGTPSMPLISDDQWLKEHAFHVTRSGDLDARYRHAEPAFLCPSSI